jgi:hypothetical protein
VNEDLVVQAQEIAPTATLWGSDDLDQVIEQATKVARTLEQVVRQQGLIVRIGQSDYPRVEAWTFLGSLLGVFPVVEWTRPVLEDSIAVGWEARVEARTRAGEIVGAAEAECLRSERSWAKRDDYALRSMAQTRAVSKALRLPLGFVMQLAGFNPTPAEEMTIEGSSPEPSVAAAAPQAGVSGESAQPASGDVHDPAAGTPFQYDVDAPVEPTGARAPVYISEKQRTRLWTIAQKCGVDEAGLRDIVREFIGEESTKLIPVGVVYEGIVAAVQAKGA